MPAVRAFVLVEGPSDKAAVEALARRLGRDLGADGISVVAIGGAQAIGRVLRDLGSRPDAPRIAGLCDAGEELVIRLGLERSGAGPCRSREAMEALGFYVCQADLEDELIRAIGVARVEEIFASEGELGAFRTFQRQPEWRLQASAAQLRRFIGVHSGRKVRYASLLVDALHPDRVPRPLDRLLAGV